MSRTHRLRWKLILFLLQHSTIYQAIHHQFNIIIINDHTPKVFCIGDVKTGTSSLYKALRILGYRTVRVFDNGRLLTKNWNEYLSRLDNLEKQNWKDYIDRIKATKYDAFIDFPLWYSNLYQEIDKAILNSKFILTIRDTKGFEKSYKDYFQGSPWETTNNQELHRRSTEFEKHNTDVKNYFKNNSSQLLIMNLFQGDGWKELCEFLDKTIPNRPFPHKNRGKYKKPKIRYEKLE